MYEAVHLETTGAGRREIRRTDSVTIFRTLLAATLVSSAAWPALAAGPVDAAKALFDRGVEQLEAGHFNRACPAIEKSYQLDPRPGTLFTLAECEAKRGRLATAVQRARRRRRSRRSRLSRSSAAR